MRLDGKTRTSVDKPDYSLAMKKNCPAVPKFDSFPSSCDSHAGYSVTPFKRGFHGAGAISLLVRDMWR